MERVISLLGLFAMLAIAWALSAHRWKVNLRVVVGGLALQFGLAVFILKTNAGQETFALAAKFFTSVLGFVDQGSEFLFGVNARPDDIEPKPAQYTLLRSFAFGILPTIVFFSSLMAILYHIGIMQWVVKGFAWIMQKTLKTSGAETLSAAANVFVGQTEAPLVIRPYIAKMTLSELNVVMVGGFATIAGSVLAAYVGMGINATDLLAASVISAPAAMLIAKVMQPETQTPSELKVSQVDAVDENKCTNVLEAAADGASSGLSLALNVGAMLLVFVALVAMINAGLALVGGFVLQHTGLGPGEGLKLELILGYIMYPFAFLMGIPQEECLSAGSILGKKTVLNEFVAYLDLAGSDFSDRTRMILTYALCGFANFSSIGIQLGGIGGIAPERRSDLARLALKAMIGGTLAAFMTACVASTLLTDAELLPTNESPAEVQSVDDLPSNKNAATP